MDAVNQTNTGTCFKGNIVERSETAWSAILN